MLVVIFGGLQLPAVRCRMRLQWGNVQMNPAFYHTGQMTHDGGGVMDNKHRCTCTIIMISILIKNNLYTRLCVCVYIIISYIYISTFCN